MELFLDHGVGFGYNFEPWGTEHMGVPGGKSGVYDTYKISFTKAYAQRGSYHLMLMIIH